MRSLQSDNREDAEKELSFGEILIVVSKNQFMATYPQGGSTAKQTKDDKLNHRRKQRDKRRIR